MNNIVMQCPICNNDKNIVTWIPTSNLQLNSLYKFYAFITCATCKLMSRIAKDDTYEYRLEYVNYDEAKEYYKSLRSKE